MEYILLLVILVMCVFAKYGKFSLLPRYACVTSMLGTDDYSDCTRFIMRRSEKPGHAPSIDQLILNEVCVNNADDCFYKNVNGVIVKYVKAE